MRVVFDFGKVQYITAFWVNQEGCELDRKPKCKTYHGQPLSKSIMMPEVITADGILISPRQSQYERAKARGLFDTWNFHIKVQFASNHAIHYAGKRATSIWKEWNRRQFKKQKGNKCK